MHRSLFKKPRPLNTSQVSTGLPSAVSCKLDGEYYEAFTEACADLDCSIYRVVSQDDWDDWLLSKRDAARTVVLNTIRNPFFEVVIQILPDPGKFRGESSLRIGRHRNDLGKFLWIEAYRDSESQDTSSEPHAKRVVGLITPRTMAHDKICERASPSKRYRLHEVLQSSDELGGSFIMNCICRNLWIDILFDSK